MTAQTQAEVTAEAGCDFRNNQVISKGERMSQEKSHPRKPRTCVVLDAARANLLYFHTPLMGANVEG